MFLKVCCQLCGQPARYQKEKCCDLSRLVRNSVTERLISSARRQMVAIWRQLLCHLATRTAMPREIRICSPHDDESALIRLFLKPCCQQAQRRPKPARWLLEAARRYNCSVTVGLKLSSVDWGNSLLTSLETTEPVVQHENQSRFPGGRYGHPRKENVASRAS